MTQMPDGLNSQRSGTVSMGYYTSFFLNLHGEQEEIKKFESDLYEESGRDTDIKELIETGTVYAKLYKLKDHINAVAPKHPGVLVVLERDGEESDDLWEARWKGNEFESQSAIIPPFENKNLAIPCDK